MIQPIVMGGKVGSLAASKKGLGTTPADVLTATSETTLPQRKNAEPPPDDVQNRRLDDLLAK
jgi:hypothetical protein